MRFGLFCNQQRARTDVAASWREDMAEIVAADRLGFEEAWVSEHTGSSWLPDALPSPDHMICALAGLTERIRLGPAIRRLALYHPLQVAIEAAVCDQLTGGRYMFGFGRGGPVSGWGQRGTEWEQTHDMMVEGIDLITQCFRNTEPFDFDGRFYRGKSITLYPRPVQPGGPPIYMATGNPILLKLGVERGFNLLTSQFATPAEIDRIGTAYAAAGAERSRERLTAVRGIFIADSDEAAVAMVADDWKRHIAFNQKHFPFNFKSWAAPGQAPTDVTFEQLLDRGLMFIGSPAGVAQRIRTFHEEAGGFGTLLLVTGRDWGSLEQREQSLQMFAEQVIPALADLGPVPVQAHIFETARVATA